MRCLDSVLHTGLISLVSLNLFEICWWGGCVSVHAFSAGAIVMGENSGVFRTRGHCVKFNFLCFALLKLVSQ